MTSLGKLTLATVLLILCSACTQTSHDFHYPDNAYMAGSYYSEPFDPS